MHGDVGPSVRVPTQSRNFVALIRGTGTIQSEKGCSAAKSLSTPVGGLAGRGPVTQLEAPGGTSCPGAHHRRLTEKSVAQSRAISAKDEVDPPVSQGAAPWRKDRRFSPDLHRPHRPMRFGGFARDEATGPGAPPQSVDRFDRTTPDRVDTGSSYRHRTFRLGLCKFGDRTYQALKLAALRGHSRS